MHQRGVFDLGVLVGILLMLGVQAVYWFIASWGHDVGLVRSALAAFQLLVGLGGAVWLVLRRSPYARRSG